MLGYVVRRLALAVSFVWAASFGSFVAFGLSFDPAYEFNICGNSCKVQRDAMVAEFHLHDPILDRYWLWLSGLFRHGFGDSPSGFGRGISSTQIDPLLWRAAGVSAQLMVTGLALTVLFSILVGVASARRPGSPLDLVLRLLAYLTWSMPTFLTGVLLYRWLIPHGWFLWGAYPGGGFVRWVRLMTLPSVTLALGLIGLYSRYVRTAALTELRQPYVTVARAKGLSETRVTLRHVLRNALGPFVSVLSLDIAAIVGASLAADWVFHIGGLALFLYLAIQRADPFELTAVVVVVAGVVAAFTVLSDLAVAWLDPRTRASART